MEPDNTPKESHPEFMAIEWQGTSSGTASHPNKKKQSLTEKNNINDDDTLSSCYFNDSFEDDCMSSSRTRASSSTTLESDFLPSPTSTSSDNYTRVQEETLKDDYFSGSIPVKPSYNGSYSSSDTTTSYLSIAALIDEFSTEKVHDLDNTSSFERRNAQAELSCTQSINKLPEGNRTLKKLLIERAKALLNQRKYAKCIEDCALAIKLAYKEDSAPSPAPTKDIQLTRAFLCKAQALKDMGRYEAAIVAYEEVVCINQSSNAILMVQINLCKQALFNEQGHDFFEQGKYKHSENVFTKAINVSPTKSDDLVLLLNNRAASLMKQGQYNSCLQDCEASIELAYKIMNSKANTTLLVKKSKTTIEKMLSQALIRKAQALEALGRYQMAVQAFGEAKSFDYTKEAQTSEGIRRCRQVMFKDRGSTNFKKGLFKEAEVAYTCAIKDLPPSHGDLVLLLNNRAAAYLKQRKYEQSLGDCESAIHLAKEMVKSKTPVSFLLKKSATTAEVQLVKALLRKARSLEGLDRLEEAITTYERVLNDGANNSQAREGIRRCMQGVQKNAGDAFFKKAEYESAESSYTRAINDSRSKNGDLLILLNCRAAAFIEQEKYGPSFRDSVAAIDLARYCIKINEPLTPIMERMVTTAHTQLFKALHRKARALKGLRRYTDAIEAYEESIRFDATSCTQLMDEIRQCKQFLYKEQGDSYLQKLQFSNAEDSYTKAIDISISENLTLLTLFNNRALVYLKQKKFGEALNDSESVLNLAHEIKSDDNTKMKVTLNQELVKAHVTKAQGLEALGKPEDAVKSYEEAMKLTDFEESAIKEIRESVYRCKYKHYKDTGNSFFRKGSFMQATKYYSHLIALVPSEKVVDRIPALNNRAASLIEQEKYKDCLQDCAYAINLAKEHIENKRPVISEIFKNSGTTLQEQLTKAVLRKARALEGLDRYKEAVASYEEGLTFGDIEFAKAGIQRCQQALHKKNGDKAMKNREFVQAEASYSNAIDITPPENSDLILLWNSRAKAFVKQLKYVECLNDCASAIDLAYSKLDKETHDSQLMKKAKTTIKEQLIHGFYLKAQALEMLKRYEAAITAYEDVITLDESLRAKIMEKIKRCRILHRKQRAEQAEAEVSDTVKEMRAQEKKRQAEEAEKAAKEDMVNEKIYMWKSGKQGDLRALLCSLESILWPEVLVKGVKIDISSSELDCKKLYMKVITKIHPDKLPKTSTVEQRLIATRVFQILDEHWKGFKSKHNL